MPDSVLRYDRSLWTGKTTFKTVLLFLLNILILIGIITFLLYVTHLDGFLEYVTSNNYFLYLLLCVFLLCCIVCVYYFVQNKAFIFYAKNIFLLFAIIDISVITCYIISNYINIYCRPIAVLALLSLLLINKRDALFLALFFALLMFSIDSFYMATADITNTEYASLMINGLASVLAVSLVGSVKNRGKVLLMGFVICLPILVIITLFELSQPDLFKLLIYGFVGGMGSVILFWAYLPIFEIVFGCITSYRLRELTDHSAPLIQQLKEKAPGTFNHSVVLAYMAEACASALDEDTALARTAAYYHDVGKLRQPEFFTENQSGFNPHSELSPELSVDIIRSHARDGYELIKKYHLPTEIANVAIEHHGTMPIKYFYASAIKMTDGAVNIENFSYSGPKPQTKISAIIMICDACEAVSRTLQNRSSESVDRVVKSIIEERIDLEQFTDCDITMRDLTTIRKTIVAYLSGVYHSRVEYPKLTFSRKEKVEKDDE